jgi:hypothetical protein
MKLWSPLHGHVMKVAFDNVRQDGEHGAQIENILYSSPNNAVIRENLQELKEQSGYY